MNKQQLNENDKYHVKVGHTVVMVRGKSVEDAIAKARRRLAEELPLLYDVIRSLDRARFEVHRAA